MYNTPPCWCIYVAGLVAKWIEDDMGGLEGMKRYNSEKASILYDYLDRQTYYIATADKSVRSLMNVTFMTGNKNLDKLFSLEAEKRGLLNLKGHRSIGGMRASIYNAMPKSGVEALVDFMSRFAVENTKK